MRVQDDEKWMLKINGAKIDLASADPRETIKDVMQCMIDPRSPTVTVKENMRTVLEVISDLRTSLKDLPADRHTIWRRTLSLMTKALQYGMTIMDRERLDYFLYNCVLNLENLGTLPGFSTSGRIEFGLMNYNPEKRSVMKIY